MSQSFWFVDQQGAQRGPVSDEELVRLIGEGAIGRETLVWTAAMTDWSMAGQVESLSGFFRPSTPPPLAGGTYQGSQPPLEGGAYGLWQKGALVASLPVAELFGRTLLVVLGEILIIPSPWTNTSFYKWLSERVSLPRGIRLTFTGKAGDIWYVFILLSATIYVPWLLHFGQVIALLISCLLQILLIKWLCANLKSEDGRMNLSFVGEFWTFFGWNILLVVSFVTIIGWAWVIKFMMQWIFRNIHGAPQLEFTATGVSILWRSLVFGLLSALLIPIPWVLRWYLQWYISQLRVV